MSKATTSIDELEILRITLHEKLDRFLEMLESYRIRNGLKRTDKILR
jgi:hypothetical protein